MGLSCSAQMTVIGLGSLSAPTALGVHDGRAGSAHARCIAVWLRPVSIFGLLDVTTLYNEGSLTLAVPHTLACCCFDACSETLPSRFEPPVRARYVVRVLPTVHYFPAVTRSVPAVERRVASAGKPCDNHLCDFMSHPCRIPCMAHGA